MRQKGPDPKKGAEEPSLAKDSFSDGQKPTAIISELIHQPKLMSSSTENDFLVGNDLDILNLSRELYKRWRIQTTNRNKLGEAYEGDGIRRVGMKQNNKKREGQI